MKGERPFWVVLFIGGVVLVVFALILNAVGGKP